MRRFEGSALWAIWLFALLASATVAQVVGFRPNDLRPESGVDGPGWDPSRLLDETYYDEVDGWIEADFALRGAGQRARLAVDYDLFGDSPSPFVVAGDDGWLYNILYLQPSCAVLDAAVDALASAPAGFDLVVARPKAFFHPDPLPDRNRDATCVAPARVRFDGVGAGRLIDIDAPLMAEVADGRDVFLRDDTHWSTTARLVVAEAIVDRFRPGLWDETATVEVEVARLAALRRLIGDAVGGTMPGHEVQRRVVHDEQIFSQFADLLVFQRSRSEEEDVIAGVTYLIGDSQMAHVVPLIDSYFEELHYINWLRVEVGGRDLDGSVDPDRIVVQTIEPEAGGRLANPYLRALTERLPSSDP